MAKESGYKPGSLHRWPGEESVGLYPGLVISDGEHSRVTGSITVGRSRLPVWAFIAEMIRSGFQAASEDYYQPEYHEEFGQERAIGFFANLMELRGEFGRLLLVLADAERCELSGRKPWYVTKRHRKRVRQQLERCVALLDAQEPNGAPR